MIKKAVTILLITAMILTCVFPIYANSIVSITEVEISIDIASQKVTVQGKISSGANKNITIRVINPKGELDYIDQTVSQAGGSFFFTFRPNEWIEGAFDLQIGGEGIDTLYTEEFQLGTFPQNHPPVLNTIGNKTIQKGQKLTFTVSASDEDGDTLTYSAKNLPAGATFDSKTGAFSWTPGVTGTFEVTFSVSDGIDSDSETVKITVTGPSTGGGGGYIPPVQTEDDLTEIESKPDVNGVSNAQFGKGALRKAIENAKDGIARLKVIGTKDAVEVLINLPAGDINLAVEKGIKRIELDVGFAIFSVNPETLKNSNGKEPSNVGLSIKKVDISVLPEELRNVVGNDTVYDISLSVDGDKISGFEKGNIVIMLDYTLKSGEKPYKVVVYYIDDNGSLKVVKNGIYNTSNGKVEFKPEHLSMYAAAYTDVTFSDISSVKWANEAIESLAAREIISGLGDGTFRPNNKVTRAEFIRMLMLAFELADEEAVCTFSDVKDGAWYYEPIAAAEKLGIVYGKGDGTFGVNDEILRQDMAAMVYRAAQLIGIDLGDDMNVALFTDEAEVSGYAKDSVAAMQKAGIINGVGDGRFLPKNNAIRAEAAVIIYRLFNKTL